ncbi:MAG: hypothetical protein AB2556_23315, partial [Candidatus Thiodiazotropha sp.]
AWQGLYALWRLPPVAARLYSLLPALKNESGLKFLREQQEGEWAVEDKFDPVRVERKKGQTIIEISRDTKPGVLTGIDRVFFQNAYPAVAYDLYQIRDPDPANLAPLRDGRLNSVAQRVVEFFEGALRGLGLTPTWRRKYKNGKREFTEVAQLVKTWLNLSRFSKNQSS